MKNHNFRYTNIASRLAMPLIFLLDKLLHQSIYCV